VPEAAATDLICDHIASVYKENSPQRTYFLMLYSIFSEFLEDVSEDALPNERAGYRDSVIWQKLHRFQKDAATGIVNKLETYNGCILAESVGFGKTFTALAVIKHYELPQSDSPCPLSQKAGGRLDCLQGQPDEQSAAQGPSQL
jgi:SNF2 family DNA or RNA helicase